MTRLALVFALVAVLTLAVACGGSRSADPSEPGGGGGGRCAQGEYFTPGCSDEPGLIAGCYVRCQAGACPDGTTCGTVTVTPACASGEGEVACDACGEELELCLPQATE